MRAVGERTFYWSVTFSGAPWDDPNCELAVHVRSADGGGRIVARASVLCVDPVLAGLRQDSAITPRFVRALIESAPGGWPEAGTLELVPSASLAASVRVPFDLTDEWLRAACVQWFVPYPGRAALQRAHDEEGGDVAKIAARFPRTKPAQIEGWLADLGIATPAGPS